MKSYLPSTCEFPLLRSPHSVPDQVRALCPENKSLSRLCENVNTSLIGYLQLCLSASNVRLSSAQVFFTLFHLEAEQLFAAKVVGVVGRRSKASALSLLDRQLRFALEDSLAILDVLHAPRDLRLAVRQLARLLLERRVATLQLTFFRG